MKIKNKSNGWGPVLKHITENRPLTTFEVSRVCGVVHGTVSKWVDEGKLNAFKTPGGHRRVKMTDLLVFLKIYDIPVPPEIVQAARQTHKEEAVVKASRTVLVVEDDQNVSQILLEFLREAYPGFQILLASDGFEAGRLTVAANPDLIILDLILPGMDGFKVLENIRKDKSLPGIKIIAMTGFDNAENRERLSKAGGADGFLPKPMDLNRLRETIVKLLKVKGER